MRRAWSHFFLRLDQAWYEHFCALPARRRLLRLAILAAAAHAQVPVPAALPGHEEDLPGGAVGLAYVLDISPVVHRVVLCHLSGCQDPAAWYHTLQILFFLVSAYFFSCPVLGEVLPQFL